MIVSINLGHFVNEIYKELTKLLVNSWNIYFVDYIVHEFKDSNDIHNIGIII